jgi:hypothetical protein
MLDGGWPNTCTQEKHDLRSAQPRHRRRAGRRVGLGQSRLPAVPIMDLITVNQASGSPLCAQAWCVLTCAAVSGLLGGRRRGRTLRGPRGGALTSEPLLGCRRPSPAVPLVRATRTIASFEAACGRISRAPCTDQAVRGSQAPSRQQHGLVRPIGRGASDALPCGGGLCQRGAGPRRHGRHARGGSSPQRSPPPWQPRAHPRFSQTPNRARRLPAG